MWLGLKEHTTLPASEHSTGRERERGGREIGERERERER